MLLRRRPGAAGELSRNLELSRNVELSRNLELASQGALADISRVNYLQTNI
jgi:hypothetical protein